MAKTEKRKAKTQVMVPDGAGGMRKLEDRRFEQGDWPIRFEIPATQEQADKWSRYLKWGCHKRGWSSSSFGQLERRENSGTITVVGDGGPQLDIVWEHKPNARPGVLDQQIGRKSEWTAL
jgi:hypothetical protein